MTPTGLPREARIFAKKATQYLESAEDDLDAGRYNPAVSDSVISGINACDAICIAGTGRYNASADHTAVFELLRQAGEFGRNALPLIQVLIPQKNLAQYRSILNSEEDAIKAIAAAGRLVELARQAIANLP